MVSILEVLSCYAKVHDINLVVVNAKVWRLDVSVDAHSIHMHLLNAVEHTLSYSDDLPVALFPTREHADVVINVIFKVLHDQVSPVIC